MILTSRLPSRQGRRRNKQQLEPLEPSSTIILPNSSPIQRLTSLERSGSHPLNGSGSSSTVSTPRGFDDSYSVKIAQVVNLREFYVKAKQLHEEYRTAPPIALLARNYNEKAARLYYSLHTLLYASICASKTEHLEKYVRAKGPSFHKKVFDITEWQPVLLFAKECRVQEVNQLKMELNAQRKVICQCLYQSYHALRSYRLEMSAFKATVVAEIFALQQLFTSSQTLLKQGISRFVMNQDETLNKLRLNVTNCQKEVRKEIQAREVVEDYCQELKLKIALITLERDTLRDQLDEITTTQIIPLTVERDGLQVELKKVTLQVEEMKEKMNEMKAEKIQSDELIKQLQHQLAEALEKHNNHALHERHQQSIDELVQQMEELRHQHAADVQSLKNEHEMELRSSLKTFEGPQRNELMTGLAVTQQDVNETPPLITVTAAKDSDLVDGQEATTTDLAFQTKAKDTLTLVEEELALAKNEIMRLNELIMARKGSVVIITGAVISPLSSVLLSRPSNCYSPIPIHFVNHCSLATFPPPLISTLLCYYDL